MTYTFEELKEFLDQKAETYNKPAFIENDPVSVPHSFNNKEDKEIMGFFAAVFAWGQRKTIINKSFELARRFDNDPYSFIIHHHENDLRQLEGFRHRTFNDTDLMYFVHFLKQHYTHHNSLEDAFIPKEGFTSIENSLIHFEKYFFDDPFSPQRSRKHIATPARNSTCKRINMFLRWMVRNDNKGVDFGIWKKIPQSALICPIDVHVDRIARKLGLIRRKQTDWSTAIELTQSLRKFDPNDPVKYDFALFGLGVDSKSQ